MTTTDANFGWLTTFRRLPLEEPLAIRVSLAEYVRDASDEQRMAWDRSIPVVQDAARVTAESHPESRDSSVLFEYSLPREGGRRPDVVVLENGAVVVVEFKGKRIPSRLDLDQVAAYARDIRGYHSASHGRPVYPVLVPLGADMAAKRVDGVDVLPANDLAPFLKALASQSGGPTIDGTAWAEAEYSPLPGLVQAARDIFHGRPLPHIKRAESAGIPKTLKFLVATAHRAAREGSRYLVLLTGVPGSGKTLVGLQFVHRQDLDDLVVADPRRVPGAPAVFLSGNGPLVDVLRHALKGESGEEKVFVQGIKNYLKQYEIRQKKKVPPEQILVFDEAQRAWDKERVATKQNVAASEPELLVSLASRIPSWSMVLGLIGEGQEIHVGEEAGLRQWAEAIQSCQSRSEWRVLGPPKLSELFLSRDLPFESAPDLDLTVTLRSHLASAVHEWVGLLLAPASQDLGRMHQLADDIVEDGFVIHVTRSLDDAKSYAKERYLSQPDRRYGLVASSMARNLVSIGVNNRVPAMYFPSGKWFNDPAHHSSSCCAFQLAAHEFICQGLELDLPILCWGDDLYRTDGKWVVKKPDRGSQYRDASQLRINSYRVLLTRGRDGVVVFVPQDGTAAMDQTANFLLEAGARNLRTD